MESSQNALHDDIHLLNRGCCPGLGSRGQQRREPFVSTSPRARSEQSIRNLCAGLDQFWSLHWQLVRPSSLTSTDNTLTWQKPLRMLDIRPFELLFWSARQVTHLQLVSFCSDQARRSHLHCRKLLLLGRDWECLRSDLGAAASLSSPGWHRDGREWKQCSYFCR